MTLTTGTAGPLLTPEQVESLLIKPVLAASVALNPLCSRVLRPTALSVKPPAEWVVTAVRRDVQVKGDRSVFFASDRVAVRAICRVGFGFPHTAASVRIRLIAS